MPAAIRSRRRAVAALATVPLWMGAGAARAQDRAPVRVGLMAALSVRSWTAPKAIATGLRLAVEHLNAAGGVLGGRPLELVEFDHRSTTAMAQQAATDAAAMPEMTALFCDSFSPAALEVVPTVHDLGLPLLNPWASADAIVDHGRRPNWTFRLSLRDSWAMPAIARAAARQRLGQLGLMAISNGWGRSNEAALKAALATSPTAARLTNVEWHQGTDGPEALRQRYLKLVDAGAQGIVLVAAVDDSCALMTAMQGLEPARRVPVLSHWGLTAGDFAAVCRGPIGSVDLQVVQTFAFSGSAHPRAREIEAEAARRMGVASPGALPSPAGVAQAYDLMHLLARAIQAAGSTARPAIRDALENLGRHRGLVKTFDRPFTRDDHEGLTEHDVFLARFDGQGVLRRA